MEQKVFEGFRLSPLQERLWRLQDGETRHPYRATAVVRLASSIDPGALAAALHDVVARHEILRTTFRRLPGMELPLQVIGDSPDLALGTVVEPGTLGPPEEPPLRAALLDSGPRRMLVLHLPALCADARTMELLVRDLARCYAALTQGAAVPGEPVQYAEIAGWQSEVLASQSAAARRYWQERGFARSLAASLPFESKATARFEVDRVPLDLPAEWAREVDALAAACGASAADVLAAGWLLVLRRLSGEDAAVLGVACHGRNYEELEEALGLFASYLPLQCPAGRESSFLDLVRQVKEGVSELQKWQETFSWSLLPDEECGPGFFPFVFEHAEAPADLTDEGAPFYLETRNAWPDRFKMRLAFVRRADALAAELDFDTACFRSADAAYIRDRFGVLLRDALCRPGTAIGDLDLLGEAERHRLLVEFNRTNGATAGEPARSVVERFAEQAARTPDGVAALLGEEALSFHGLRARSKQLAGRLRALGVGPEVRVALCLERSLEMLIGLFGILEAGGAYVPVDPTYPEERLAFLLQDALAPVLVTRGRLAPYLPRVAGQAVVDLDLILEEGPDLPLRAPERESLAYVIYTSGSTGRPKGVMVSHGSLAAYIAWALATYPVCDGRGAPVHSPLGFDLTVTSLLLPLLAGRTAVLLPEEEELEGLAGVLRDGGHSLIKLTPSHLEALAALVPAAAVDGCARSLVIGGEALSGEMLAFWRERSPSLRLFNEYGPTETVVGCCVHEIPLGPVTAGPVPIGRPIAGARLYVLDARQEPVPAGVAGELYIAGRGVARGYLSRPGLTALRFVPDPFASTPGARLYRTGDLVRCLLEGGLEFLGRVDEQVKIRGFRIEPGEIEATLLRHPSVREAAVIAREDEPGDRRLVAYIVPGEEGRADAEELLAFLSRSLPPYMLPSAWVPLPALPRSLHGKLDRRALPRPERGHRVHNIEFVAPRTPVEEVLAGIWSDLLGVDRVGAYDSFFDLGGHSLRAMQVVVRVRDLFGAEMPLHSLFEAPTVAGFARGVEAAVRAGVEPEVPRLLPAPRDRELPLSFAQQRLWFLHRLEPGSPAYNISTAVRLRGPLAPAVLATALAEIVRRHEALRTIFPIGSAGEPVQVVLPTGKALPELDLVGLDERAETEARRIVREISLRPFDLARGPLFRPTLLRLGAEDHVLIAAMHHIVSDGWSMGILVRELGALYEALDARRPSPLPALPVQYADFALWQRSWLSGETLEAETAFWRRRLEALPVLLELPTDRPRPAVQTTAGAEHPFRLESELTGALRRLALGAGATLFMGLLAAFQVLLARLSGQEDFGVGTPIAGRNRLEIERLIGFFVNTLVLRADLAGDPSFRELLVRTRRTALEAYSHQDLPFEKLVEEIEPERSLAHTPLFQTMFVLQNAPQETPGLSRLRLTPFGSAATLAKFDLTLALVESAGGLAGSFEHNTDLFDRSTVHRWAGSLRALLAAAVADPEARISDLTVLGDSDRHQVLAEWNATQTAWPADLCLHQWIEARAQRAPEAVAVWCEGRQLTYGELEARATRLARHLRRLGVEPDAPVAIALERSLELVIGLLAILKAGGAYMPLDPSYPRERLASLLGDARAGGGAPLLLTSSALEDLFRELVPDPSFRIVRPDAAAGSEEDDRGPLPDLPSEALAYVIFTSGSTGRPKGVMNHHRAICNRLLWMQETYGLGSGDRVLQKTPLGFDVSVWEFFWPLIIGAPLVLTRPEGHRDSSYLVDLIAEQGITTLHFVPSMLQAFLQTPGLARCRSLRRVVASGEALSGELRRLFFERLEPHCPGVELHNLYGPTEAAVDVTSHACRADETEAAVPIGRPIANLEIHLLDTASRNVPTGAVGELCIGGVGLARGYLGRPALTAERFVPHSWKERPGERLYRTGDLARHRTDGEIEFLGRIDHQVKVRGFRIEPGEIEAALLRHPRVAEAVVVSSEIGSGDRRLVAYVVGRDGAAPPPEELREHLGRSLPEFMVPALFIALPALPLSPNGKLDRRALPAPGLERPDLAAGYSSPRTPAEEVLCAVWGQVLGLERVGIHDNFFALGGDSILSLRVIARAAERGLALSLQDVFRHQTVAGLAGAVHDAVPGAAPAPRAEPFSLVTPGDRERLPSGLEDAYPLATLQAGMLYHMALTPEEPLYHNVDSWHIRGSFELEPFREAVRRVVARHPMLRTSFDLTTFGEPLQLVHREAVLPVVVEDIRHLPKGDQERWIDELIAREKARPFRPADAPQMRFHVARRSGGTFQLTVVENHAISDGWSLHSTLSEIFQLYLSLLEGAEPAGQPPLAATYRDFVALERQALASPESAAFWEEVLRDPPLLELPRWSGGVSSSGPRMRNRQVVLSRGLSEELRVLAARQAVPLKSVLLAAHVATLRLLTGEEDVLTGLVANGRAEVPEGDQVHGLFLNTVPFRLRTGGRTWGDLVRTAFALEREMLAHRRYPFSVLQRRRGERPLFEVAFNYIHFHAVRDLLRSGSLEVLGFKGIEGASFVLFAHFSQALDGSQLDLQLEHDTRVLTPEQMTLIGRRYVRVLSAMTADPEARLEEADLLEAAERQQLLYEWNDTDSGGGGPGWLELFAGQAARSPEAVAVSFRGERLTYGDLEARARRLAAHLRSLGVGPEVRVALCAERSLDLVIGLLGILKAGGAYVPLDPQYPRDRLLYMLEDSRAAVLLAGRDLLGLFPTGAALVVPLDPAEWTGLADGAPPAVLPQHLAYVLYTSGSTGRPKGVAIEHRSLAALVEWAGRSFAKEDLGGVLASTSLCFDLSVFELLVPLGLGGKAILAANVLELADLPDKEEVRLLNSVPSAVAELLRAGALPSSVRTVNLAGEALQSDLVSRLYDCEGLARVLNLYGPTEDTTYSTAGPQARGSASPPAVGRPITGKRLYVLDRSLRPAPPGAAGEIYLGGAGLARGYSGRPDLTAERFLPDPGGGGYGERLYRTGDLARYRLDGQVEFLGRIDQQVKVRGFRIETGEIEEVLRAYPDVRECVVVLAARGQDGAVPYLAAFVVPGAEPPPMPADLRDFLRRTLPEHMVPAVIHFTEVLPRTPSGKLDRRALAALETVRRPRSSRSFDLPESDLEKRVAEVWREVLGLDEIGLHDNFFDLGGNSLMLLQVRTRLRERLGREVAAVDLLYATTVGSLARHLAGESTEKAAKQGSERAEVRRGTRDRRRLRLESRSGIREKAGNV